MLRNYLKIALRTLWKQKGITAINVLGLAAGMAVCLLVGLLFWDQVTHDDFHPGADRLYRVTTTLNDDPYAASSAGLAPALRDGVTGVETATRMSRTRRNVVVDNQGYEAQGLYAEPSFFGLFGFELEAGSPEEALAQPYTTVLTRDLARRLYGDANPIGRTLRVADVGTFTVTGVVNRNGYRSHLPFDALYSFATLEQTQSEQLDDWDASAFEYYTYLRLQEGRTAAAIEESLQEIRRQHLPPASNEEVLVQGFQLQALSDLPLGSSYSNEIAEGMLSRTLAGFLGGLALLVLLAAGFNYVNLSLARSLTRAREVGLRKTVGAHRGQVVGQFVAEAVVVALLALGVALALLQGLVPVFNRLSVVHEMGVHIDAEPGLLLYAVFLGFAVVVGAVAGLYPAWHLSKFQPSRVLKTSAQSKTPGFGWLTSRKVLVVLQFAFALIVTVSAVFFYRQARHVAETEYPVQIDQTVRVRLQDAAYGPFQQAAQQRPELQNVGGANFLPATGPADGCTVDSDRLPEPTSRPWYYALDYDAVQLLELPLIATQEFTEARFETGRAVLISETAVGHFGYSSPQEALGQPLTVTADNGEWDVQIVGIVQNFPIRRAGRTGAEPVVFHYNPDLFRVALARIAPDLEGTALSALEETWSQFDDVNPFEAHFVRDYIWTQQAAPLADVGWILGLVAGLAVLISCLGLLGIATYTVQTRTREIGIRKALGATVGSLVRLLSKDFLWLIGIAVGLGLPVAWWLNRLWLRGFKYRIELGVWTFALCAAGLLALALLAIGSQTVRAARTDPAQTLRDE